MLTLTTPDIPERLLRLPQPPTQLFCTGNLKELLEKPCVAIVGSRKVTPYGRQVTYTLASELAKQGIVIISGLALGVDSIAHQAALDVGGTTIAVLPGPVETIYPSSHRNLAANIVKQGGALVGEYPEGTSVMKHHFIARNRIIAGLADALIVTEAALKSGSLHTARFALEQGTDVLAVPGNVTSGTSEGTNNLIKSGAHLVTGPDDVLSILGLEATTLKRVTGDTPSEQVILDLLSNGQSDGHSLQLASDLSIEQFGQTLTMLEITGKIRALGGDQWSL